MCASGSQIWCFVRRIQTRNWILILLIMYRIWIKLAYFILCLYIQQDTRARGVPPIEVRQWIHLKKSSLSQQLISYGNLSLCVFSSKKETVISTNMEICAIQWWQEADHLRTMTCTLARVLQLDRQPDKMKPNAIIDNVEWVVLNQLKFSWKSFIIHLAPQLTANWKGQSRKWDKRDVVGSFTPLATLTAV